MEVPVRSTLPLFLLATLSCGNESDFYEQAGSDTWTQAENDQVDILFVVDNSRTMQEEQTTLAAGFESFASQLDTSQTRFRLGVISTSFEYGDPERGALIGDPQFLTPDTPNYEGLFAQRAQVGIDGSDFEKGLEAAAYALSPLVNLDVNGGFSRPEARLLLVFVSDEEDCSDRGAIGTEQDDNGELCYSQRNSLVPVETFVEDFRQLREDPEDVFAAAIVGLQGCDDAIPGDRYAEVARLTGGLVGNICDGDWSGVLTQLGLNATGIMTTFQLGNAPIPDTLEVYVDDVLVDPADYVYDEETWFLTFNEGAIPPRDSVIVANYTVLPGAQRPPGI